MEQNKKTRNKSHIYGKLIYNKGGNNMQWWRHSLFNKCYWKNWAVTCKRIKLEHSPTLYTKINSKWVKELNVRPENIKLIDQNTGRQSKV